MAVLAAALLPVSPAAASTTSTRPTVQWKAPAAATVGESFGVRVVIDGTGGVAGYQLQVRTDGPAELDGASAGDSPLTRVAGGHDLSVAELDGRAVIAAFLESGTAAGRFTLAHVVLVPTAPGVLRLQLDELVAVGTDGERIPLWSPSPLTIEVRAGDGPTTASAAAASPAVTTTTVAVPDDPTEPITADGVVDALERTELALEWEQTELGDDGCGTPAFDVNGDGCVDIADLVVAARWSSTTTTTTTESTEPSGSTTSVASLAAATFTVRSVGDEADSRPGNGVCRTSAGTCTLRAAIQEANASSGPVEIDFALPGPGPHVINVTRTMPRLTNPKGTTIDGYTQAGSSPNSDPTVSNAVIGIEVNGGGDSTLDAFVVVSANNVVRGLAVYGFRRPFWIFGDTATDNRVVGCFVGTDAGGTYVSPALGEAAHGLHVEQGARRTVIGGVSPADRNVISGNGRHGIGLWHNQTDDAVIKGNIVGLSPDGTRRVPNRKHGIDLNFGVSGTTVGGTEPGARNVVSGNDDSGLELSHTPLTTGNVIAGNYVGTDVSGTAAPAHTANSNRGIYIEDGARNNVVEDNVIGNNAKGGVILVDGPNGASTGNVIRGNRIGISTSGEPIPNGVAGVVVNSPDTTVGPNNVIARNNGFGVRLNLDTAVRNRITRNSIFGNASLLGIDIAPTNQVNPNDSGDVDEGPNRRLNFPVITLASPSLVTGTACPGCTVELFSSDRSSTNGSGQVFRVAVVADSTGQFHYSSPVFDANDTITATAIDEEGNTSEFARNATVGA